MNSGFLTDVDSCLDPLDLAQVVDDRIVWHYPCCVDTELRHLALPQMMNQQIKEPFPEFTVINHTRSNGSLNANRGVLFLVDDSRFNNILAQPWTYYDWLSRHPVVATPDVSMYLDMSSSEQFMAIY